MKIDTNTIVSISEANKNFSKVARIVDEKGSAIILKNNSPKYIIIQYEQAENNKFADDEDIEELSKRLINENRKAYEELAKWYG